MRAAAAAAIDLMRQVADDVFPGLVVDVPDPLAAFHGQHASMSGFVIPSHGNVALIYVYPADYIPDWEWSVQVSSGVAFSVPARSDLMKWISDRNRTSTLGRYYCVDRSEADSVAVVYETMLWGGYFKALYDNEDNDELWTLLGGRLANEMRQIVETGANDRDQVIALFGGQPFECTPRGVIDLFFASDGNPPSS